MIVGIWIKIIINRVKEIIVWRRKEKENGRIKVIRWITFWINKEGYLIEWIKWNN